MYALVNQTDILMGINAPKEHQYIIAKLITALTNLKEQGKINLIAYPETMINEAETSPVPDILLFNPETNKTELIIEITHTDGVKKDSRKVIALMNDYDVKEGFVYDYRAKKWYKFPSINSSEVEQSAFSDTINYSLNNFVL
jgi:hypothetical protein